LVKNSEESITKKRNWFARWWKTIVLSFIALIILLVIFIPYFYSNRIFQPIIKESFAQLTHDKYHLDFKNVKWNVLKSSFSLHEIQIKPNIADTIANTLSNNVEIFNLNLIEIKGIDYAALFHREVEFSYLRLDGLNVLVNNKGEKDSINIVEPKQIISEYISSIYIQEIELKQMNATYLSDRDSLVLFNDADLLLKDFFMDSLNYKIPYRIPSFSDIHIGIRNTEYFGEKNHVLMAKYSFSARAQLNNPEIKFSKLSFINMQNKNTKHFNQGQIQIGVNDFLKNLEYNHFTLPCLKIHFSSFVNDVKETKELNIDQFLDSLQNEIKSVAANLSLDTISLNIDTIIQYSSKNTIQFQNLHSQLFGSQLMDGQFSYANYFLKAEMIDYLSINTQDNMTVKSISYDEKEKNLFIKGIHYQDSISSTIISLHTANFENIDLLNSLRNKSINIDYAILDRVKVQMLEKPKKAKRSAANKNNWDFNIHRLDIINSDADIRYLGLQAEQYNSIIDSLVFNSHTSVDLVKMVKNFTIDFKKLDYHPPKKDIKISLDAISFSSLGGKLKTTKFILNQELTNKRSVIGQNVFISGIDWKNILKGQEDIILDTLILSELNLDAEFDYYPKKQNNTKDSTFYFACHYLNLPKIQIDINLLHQEQKAEVNLQRLSIESQNCLVNLSQEEFLQFDSLKLSSEYSSYWHSSDSTLFNIQQWYYDANKQIFQANKINAAFYKRDSLLKINNHLNIKAPHLYLSGINPLKYMIDYTIRLDSISFNEAEVFVNNSSESIEKEESKPLINTDFIKDILSKTGDIGFNRLWATDLKINIKDSKLNSANELNITKANLDIQGFSINQSKLDVMEDFLFSKDISLQINDLSQSINNGQQIVFCKNLQLSKSKNELKLNNIQVLSLSNEGGIPSEAFIQEMLFKDFGIREWNRYPDLSIGIVHIISPVLQIGSRKNDQKKKFSLEKLNLFPIINKQLSSLIVEDFKISNLDIDIADLQIGEEEDLHVSGIELDMTQMKLDSSNTIFSEDKFFYCDIMHIDLPAFKMKTKDNFYQIGYRKLSFNSSEKTLILDSLQLQPLYDRETFSEIIEFQKDRIELLIPQIKIDEIDFRDIVFKKKYQAQKITLVDPDIAFFKDKTIEADSSINKPMPAELLSGLPFYLNIDTIEVLNGKVKYEELASYISQPGMIHFDQLNAKLLNVSNDASIREAGTSLLLAANAKVMSKTIVTLNANFPLNSENQEFTVISSMGPIQVSEFNPIIKPLALLYAVDGEIAQMQMNVHGNNVYGSGKMILKYSDLKVEMLKKKNLKESQLVSFLANAILIKKNNNSIFRLRRGPIYFERVKFRGLFNYITHFAIIGAKTSIGIDALKTKRKIKSLNEE